MREVVVHVVPVSRQSEDETTDDPLMCMKGTKGKTGEMSGNALRAVKQVVQKEDQERCPPGDATEEPVAQGAPGRGRRLEGRKEEQSPPKNRRKRSGKNCGAVKTAGR